MRTETFELAKTRQLISNLTFVARGARSYTLSCVHTHVLVQSFREQMDVRTTRNFLRKKTAMQSARIGGQNLITTFQKRVACVSRRMQYLRS